MGRGKISSIKNIIEGNIFLAMDWGTNDHSQDFSREGNHICRRHQRSTDILTEKNFSRQKKIFLKVCPLRHYRINDTRYLIERTKTACFLALLSQCYHGCSKANIEEMRILKLTFTIIMISGCFRPLSWTSPFKRTIYNVYRLYTMGMLCIFTLTQFMDIVLNVDNPDDFTDTMHMMLTISCSLYKMIIMWLSYENIIMMVNNLSEEPFKPLDTNEMDILQRFNKLARNTTLRYTILFESTCSLIFLVSLFTDFRHKRLTYREWVPYDYSSRMVYCITYFQQMITTLHSCTVNVACDTLFCALLTHLYCQIEILEYRLGNISTNHGIARYCVYHHNRIFEFAQLINKRFAQIIGCQFIVSAFIICSSVYQLTKSALSSNDIPLIMYLTCMLAQIFVYCWFGNEIKLKSIHVTDSIFHIEWSKLNNDVKKDLMMIMIRADLPVEISTAQVMKFNLESFVGILKASYSAYNLLTRTQD